MTRKRTAKKKTKGTTRRLRGVWRLALFIGVVTLVGSAVTFFFTDQRIQRFLRERDSSDIPALYSDLRRITDMQHLEIRQIKYELEVRGYRDVGTVPKRPGEYRLRDGIFEIATRRFRAPDGTMIEPRTVSYRPDRGEIRTLSGTRLPSFELEPQVISDLVGGDIRASHFVAVEKMPKSIINAILATEDERFYTHFGIDLLGLARAMVENVRAMRFAQGGSTLTQQLAKNLLLTSQKTLARKFLELFAAVSLERHLSKDQILELYLNEIYLGQEGPIAIHGFPEATRNFFGKEIAELSIGEAALLAGIVKAPSYYSPRKHYQRSLERRNVVLAQLLEQRKITEQQYEVALRERPKIIEQRSYLRKAPHFTTAIRQSLASQLPLDNRALAGLRVYTGLDLAMQGCAERAIQAGLSTVERRAKPAPRRKVRIDGGLIAIEPHSGKIRAWVGGRDYRFDQFDHVYQGRRQIGSTVKPFLYLSALDATLNRYKVATAASVLSDEPMTIKQAGQREWSPENFDKRYRGDVTLRYALENSLNLPALYVAEKIGIPTLAATLRKFRVVRDAIAAVPSLALGAADTTLLDLTSGYSALANGGVYVKPRMYLSAIDPTGAVLSKTLIEEERVANERAVYIVTNIMQGVIERGTASKVRSLGFKGEAAGKTGTSDQTRDAWFIGFSPDLVAGVWVGYNDNSQIGLTGGAAAVPIWTEFMKCSANYHENLTFIPPEGVIFSDIDSQSGQLATDSCPHAQLIKEVFVRGTEPKRHCTLHEGDEPLEDEEFEQQTPPSRTGTERPRGGFFDRMLDGIL